MFNFEILHQSKKSSARLGEISTPHGKILTPAFVPVATAASLKSLAPREIVEVKTQIMFINTYHLWLRPGEEVVQNLGGAHKFMGWDGPLMSDSGGFQVFSLGFGIEHGVGKIANIFPEGHQSTTRNVRRLKAPQPSQKPKLVKIDETGVTFTSHLDGSTLRLTPKKSIQIQEKLGADIILAFDECTSPLNAYEYTQKALKRTHSWAKICLATKTSSNQALFGIIQGGQWQSLREQSARFIGNLPFDGLAIGGSLGKSKKDMSNILSWIIPLLPNQKPRHLLGIGEVEDIFHGVKQGIDSFDCVMPTRLARNGAVLQKNAPKNFKVNIKRAEFREDPKPIEEDCKCYTCQNFSRAYLNHLFRANEMLGPHLATIHNLTFMEKLMARIRQAIQQEKLAELERAILFTKPQRFSSDHD